MTTFELGPVDVEAPTTTSFSSGPNGPSPEVSASMLPDPVSLKQLTFSLVSTSRVVNHVSTTPPRLHIMVMAMGMQVGRTRS